MSIHHTHQNYRQDQQAARHDYQSDHGRISLEKQKQNKLRIVIATKAELLEYTGQVLLAHGKWFSELGYQIITKLLRNLHNGKIIFKYIALWQVKFEKRF